jgi:hypothetical protein
VVQQVEEASNLAHLLLVVVPSNSNHQLVVHLLLALVLEQKAPRPTSTD